MWGIYIPMGVQFGMEQWTFGPQFTPPCQISPPLVQRVAPAGQKKPQITL